MSRNFTEQAIAAHKQGDLAKAVELFQEALKEDEKDVKALEGLGVIKFQQGEYSEAEVLMREILETDPQNQRAYVNLAGVLFHLKKFDEAKVMAERGISLNPKDVKGYNNLGCILVQLDKPEEAKKAFVQSIQLNNKDPSSVTNLASILLKENDLDQAALCLKHAMSLAPNNLNTIKLLGDVSVKLNKWPDVIICYEKLIKANPEFENQYILNILAYAHNEVKNLEEKYKYLQKALEKYPKAASSYSNMGVFYFEMGDTEKARGFYKKALEINANSIEGLKGLVLTKKNLTKDEAQDYINKFNNCLEITGLTPKNQMTCYFTLGRIYDDQKDYDKAFRNYEKGNELLDSQFSREAMEQEIEGLKNYFTPQFFSKKKDLGNSSSQPIFIVGMPRSGTSLVEQILSKHPKVLACGEREDINSIAAQIGNIIKSHHPYPQCLDDVSKEAVDSMTRQYLNIKDGDEVGFEKTTDKMPHNFHHLGLIAFLFPNAKIIHCRRHPFACSLSCYFSDFFRPNLEYTYSLSDIGFYYRKYQEIMDYWKSVLPIEIFDIDYENLVENQEEESKKLVAYCGLEWDDACLEFYKSNRHLQTASTWQVRQPIYTTSLEKWKHYEKYLGPLRDELNL